MSLRTANDYLVDDGTDRALVSGHPGRDEDAYSVIDRHSAFDGTVRADRDLRIEGEVKGTIECQGTLFVAQGATVTAKIEAENITVAGDLNGDINCRGRLQMMPSGRVRGKVATQTLVINEGAYYEGQLEMAPPEERGRATGPRSLPSGKPIVSSLPTAAASDAPSATGGSTAGGAVGSPAAGGGASSTTFIRRLGGPETPWDARQNESEDEPTPPRDR